MIRVQRMTAISFVPRPGTAKEKRKRSMYFAACTIAQSSDFRQPVAIRYRRHNGTTLNIQQAFDMHEITQGDFDLASRHQDEMDAYAAGLRVPVRRTGEDGSN